MLYMCRVSFLTWHDVSPIGTEIFPFYTVFLDMKRQFFDVKGQIYFIYYFFDMKRQFFGVKRQIRG